MRSCYYCRHCVATIPLKQVRHNKHWDKLIRFPETTTRCKKELWIMNNGGQLVLRRLPATPHDVKQLQVAERCAEFEKL